MKILIKKYLFLLPFVVLSNCLLSQGFVESSLTSNGVLIQKWKELQQQPALRTAFITDTINLDPVKGILDDFSYEGPYPDTAVWLDNFVFINRGYPIAPVTIGAATFDGLNANGYPYNFNVSQTSSAQADYLTSKPIDLNYPASDSLYFSFYYQPQGRGNDPEQADSLILEFKGAGGWKNIWAKKGTTLFSSDSSWKLVMVPVTDPAFLIKGFQFRFRNYATLSGNLDHWSIDYVYLNKTRNKNDTIFKDVSFVYNTPSLINTYSAMPWNHYKTSYMKSVYNTTIRNNYKDSLNTSFSYNIYDGTGTQVDTYSGGFIGVNPYSFPAYGYLKHPGFTTPAISYTIPLLTDTTKYTIECIVNYLTDFNKKNDTVRHIQKFSNYYAYDDGSAETAFGLGGYLGAQMAEQYTSTITDTLRCIDIYFNPIITNASLYKIALKVWTDNGGKPGSALYTSDTVFSPAYNQTGHDQFTRHYLKTPLNLGAGTFYIGFEQKTTQLINVGVDKNSNNQNKIFYNTTGTWANSPSPGSLMMRPVFGTAAQFTGINTYAKKQNAVIHVYPNPANDKLYIRSDNSEKIKYTLIDLYGRTVLENTTSVDEPIDISSLSEGVYFVRTMDGTYISTTKFIKVN